VDGSREYVVEYDGKYFAMANEQRMDTFLKTPWHFHSLPNPPEQMRIRKVPLAQYDIYNHDAWNSYL